MEEFNTFEEYKLFIEDTAKMSDRRQLLSSTYITANTIILASIAFVLKDYKPDIPSISIILVTALLFAGIFISFLWNSLIFNYKKIIKLRMKTLREMEDKPGMEGSMKMYHLEDELYPPEDQKDKPKRRYGFSFKESILPKLFIGLYAIFLFVFFCINLKT